MNSGLNLTNCAKISYQYPVDHDESCDSGCAFAQKTIQVIPKIKIYSSKSVNNTAKCMKFHYIYVYNLSEYPLEIMLRIFMPSYAYYNPCSIAVCGFNNYCCSSFSSLNLGVIMPRECATVSYFGCIDPGPNGSWHLSKVDIYYRIVFRGMKCSKWYCTTENVYII